MAVTIPRLLRLLTFLKDPNKLNSMGKFQYAVRTKYLPVLIEHVQYVTFFGAVQLYSDQYVCFKGVCCVENLFFLMLDPKF
jgi:hypothetical protein